MASELAEGIDGKYLRGGQLLIDALCLFIGFFATSVNLIKIGGYVGIVTAVVAWYTSAAGIAAGMGGKVRLPVGAPVIR